MPWQIKSIFFTLIALRCFLFFFSIADILRFVEPLSHPRAILNLTEQFRLAPAMLQCGIEIPRPLLRCFTGFQDRHILRPRHPQRLFQLGRGVSIGQIKGPHTAQITGRKALPLRVLCLQIFCGHDSRAFLRSGAYGPADLIVQFHLRKPGVQQDIQRRIQRRIIVWFPNVHLNPFPAYPPW